jgi:hypothetical protein
MIDTVLNPDRRRHNRRTRTDATLWVIVVPAKAAGPRPASSSSLIKEPTGLVPAALNP